MRLQLTLKKKWFDMILSGEKPEEYREIKKYWGLRLLYKIPVPWGGYLTPWAKLSLGIYDQQMWRDDTGGAPYFQEYTSILFVNGYGADKPRFEIELKGIEIDTGNPDWGAEKGKNYFVLKLGEIIE